MFGLGQHLRLCAFSTQQSDSEDVKCHLQISAQMFFGVWVWNLDVIHILRYFPNLGSTLSSNHPPHWETPSMQPLHHKGLIVAV